MLTISQLENSFELLFEERNENRYVYETLEPYKYVCATYLPNEKKWLLFYEFNTKDGIRIELTEYYCRNAETVERFIKLCRQVEASVKQTQ